MVNVTRLNSTSSSSDSDSSEDEGPKRATYHQWRSYLMKLDPRKNGTPTPNALRNGAPTQNTQSVLNRIKATSAAINPI